MNIGGSFVCGEGRLAREVWGERGQRQQFCQNIGFYFLDQVCTLRECFVNVCVHSEHHNYVCTHPLLKI